MQRESETQRRKYPKHFWTPVWVCIAFVVLASIYELGDYFRDQVWKGEYRDRLAVAAMRSPGDALNMAEDGVEKDFIQFPVYRDLLASALSRGDGDARGMALNSIANVLAYGGVFSDDLRTWFHSKPPQVFIYARKDIDQSVGQTLEEELKQHGMDVVGRGAREPDKITKTVVYCYEENVCNQSARLVVSLLQGQGYEAEGPTQDKTYPQKSTQGHEAMMLVNQSRIDVVLALPKNIQLASAGFDVRWLQQALKTLGYDPKLKVDGDFKEKTRAALKAFQKSAGLPADGVYTVTTRDKILQVLSNSPSTASLL
ncbi:peptidoglycan-binding domain-containing protein [Mesorhizobium sp. M00.F.Ca.ET.216.01.1.1]|uniref:peptidoglycan-binding domain-containing protein n=1 Tax=Mesorhizobium sp. M00.F.Ca.ET.216.01.1.1 TaxID=2500528 RepID=UPI000FDBB52B|nr:peptidoglycan-binding domain-containing protein [Mesorhizobium sp. M00.F.Ca.ET.216.01.1.1]TGQ35035.1 peptidoglycan-binding protein [Mesorhizobium sp. M00.F.Ca.ET.216.01.1.1]TJW09195.1 MAG: peptidoglycan-binding protein [Mesorhizobium sp.]